MREHPVQFFFRRDVVQVEEEDVGSLAGLKVSESETAADVDRRIVLQAESRDVARQSVIINQVMVFETSGLRLLIRREDVSEVVLESSFRESVEIFVAPVR